MKIKYEGKVYRNGEELRKDLIEELKKQNRYAKEVQEELRKKIEEIENKYKPTKENTKDLVIEFIKLILKKAIERIDDKASIYGMQWASEWSKGIFERDYEMLVKVFKDIKKVNKKIIKSPYKKDLIELFRDEDLKEVCEESIESKSEVIGFLTYIENFVHAHEKRNEIMIKNLSDMESLTEFRKNFESQYKNHTENENE